MPDAADPTADLSADLAFAVEQARRAGVLLMDSYGRVERIDKKSRRDVVTDVDYASEALIIEAIRDRYPGDAILSEEAGSLAATGAGGAPANGRVWMVDPVDGTVNYANGIPFFCVSIALVVDERPAVGVVFDPTRDDCYTATATGDARLNGEPVVVSNKDDMGDFVVSLTVIGRGGMGRERAVGREVRIPRRMGSAALALAYVASGRFDAFVQSGGLSLWDVAAAGLIAERGGATVTDASGGPWFDLARGTRQTSIVAAPPTHHARMVELVGGETQRLSADRPRSGRRL